MYTPKFNQVTDRNLLLEAMRASSFAILFGPQLVATHLPLVVRDEGEHGVLMGHFARANTHWAELAGRETLVVFPGPHAYISPSLYVEPLTVPTWNYIAVHAYGTLNLVEDEAGKQALLQALIEQHDPGYVEKLRSMPAGFQRTMLAGITGFRILIDRVEGKFKLSQNRPAADRHNVRAAMAAGSREERELARWMERLIPQV